MGSLEPRCVARLSLSTREAGTLGMGLHRPFRPSKSPRRCRCPVIVRTDFLVGLLERHRHARDHSSGPNHLCREKVGDGKKIREKTRRANREGRPWIVMAAGTSERTRHRGLTADQRSKMRSSARERRVEGLRVVRSSSVGYCASDPAASFC